MAVPWDEDPAGSEQRTLLNALAVLRAIVTSSNERNQPSVAAAQNWHRQLYAGITLPVAYYAGEVRDSDPRFPELIDYEVSVGLAQGALAADVPQQLAIFERQSRVAVDRIDTAIRPGAKPATPQELRGVITLCALMHGEWVRIHPFANGNGRTARLWANWVAVRYGLPPFLNIKPRPADPYRLGAVASMRGNHGIAVPVFGQLLRDALSS
jgi:fido (protein-threonine AMPylation protein)